MSGIGFDDHAEADVEDLLPRGVGSAAGTTAMAWSVAPGAAADRLVIRHDVYKDQGPAIGSFNGLHPKSNFLAIKKLSGPRCQEASLVNFELRICWVRVEAFEPLTHAVVQS